MVTAGCIDRRAAVDGDPQTDDARADARPGADFAPAADGSPHDAAPGPDAQPDAASPCVPAVDPTEGCNGADDDCDGLIDEGLPWTLLDEPGVVWTGEGAALSAHLSAHGDGLLAGFRLGFVEPPNGMRRLLDETGAPVGEAAPFSATYVSQGPTLSRGPEGSTLMAWCGARGGESRAIAARIERDGTETGEAVRAPTDRSCGAAEPAQIGIGARRWFAWTDNSTGPVPDHEVLLERSDLDGRAQDWWQLHDTGDLTAAPRLAARGDRGVVVYGVREGQRWLVEARPLDGDAPGDPLRLEPPEGVFFGGLTVAATQDGWLVLALDRAGVGALRARLRTEADGRLSVIEPPTRVELNGPTVFRPDALNLLPLPGGRFLLSGMANVPQVGSLGFFAGLDPDGGVESVTLTDNLTWWPSAARAGREVRVLFGRPVAEQRVDLLIQRVGCVPEAP